jgi:hypothetical protein
LHGLQRPQSTRVDLLHWQHEQLLWDRRPQRADLNRTTNSEAPVRRSPWEKTPPAIPLDHPSLIARFDELKTMSNSLDNGWG